MRTPLMLAFRAAHAAKDSRVVVDLRDESGERVISGRRTTKRGAASESAIRREISTDLEMLMNTINLESTLPLEDNNLVRYSIINFGLPDVTHRSIDENGVDNVVLEIETALKTYEPRLVKSSLRVERDTTVDTTTLAVRFVVRAEMLANPLKVPVEFYADVLVDSGKIAISRL